MKPRLSIELTGEVIQELGPANISHSFTPTAQKLQNIENTKEEMNELMDRQVIG